MRDINIVKFGFLFLLLILLLISCTSYLKPGVLDPTTSYFPTKSKIPSNGVLVEEPFQKRYKKLLFVYTTPTTSSDVNIDVLITQSFKNMEVFDKVVTKYEMEQLIYDNNLQNEVITMTDRLELHNLYKQIGDFLMVRIDAELYKMNSSGHYFIDFQVSDPKDGKLVLQIRNSFADLIIRSVDHGLLYPMYNAFLEWTRGEKITTGQGKGNFQLLDEYNHK